MLPEAVHPHLREGSRPGNLVPDSKSFASESAVISGREQVPSGSEVRADDSVYLDKTLACRADLNRRIRFSRSRVGWCEFSARLFKYRCCLWATPGMTMRLATA